MCPSAASSPARCDRQSIQIAPISLAPFGHHDQTGLAFGIIAASAPSSLLQPIAFPANNPVGRLVAVACLGSVPHTDEPIGRHALVTVHQTIGTLVVLAFLALTTANIVRLRVRNVPVARPLSFAAAGLLFIQYVIGFSLLGDDHKITAWHYVFALAAILTVGIEHGMAGARTPESSGNARLAAAATSATTLLTVIAYAIGSSN